MKTLIQKEIRLLLPAFIVALLLVWIPAWMVRGHMDDFGGLCGVAFFFGAVIMGLSTFGREFGLRTFPLILAQPIERGRIWWTKTAVLGVAMLLVLIGWILSCVSADNGRFSEEVSIAVLTVLVTFAGGLWTTLLLRQVAAAFWFTVLVPGLILGVVSGLGGAETMAGIALTLYSIAGFLFAWRMFMRAQEAAWTGGVVSIPGLATRAGVRTGLARVYRPVAALFRKEFQVHQVGLMGIGVLFLLHLLVIWLRKAGTAHLSDTSRTALEVFGGLWLLVPFMVGAASVAEERKLGTADSLFCQPVSARIQFALKLLFVVVLGGLLSAFLLWTAESIGTIVGAGADTGWFGQSAWRNKAFLPPQLVVMSFLFIFVSLVAFYGSTLAHNIIQALAAGITTAIVLGSLFRLAVSDVPYWWAVEKFDLVLFRGPLLHYIAWPTLVIALLWFSWRTFRKTAGHWSSWLGNALGMCGTVLCIFAVTVGVYNRVWELALPGEPAHGPRVLPELSVGQKPLLKSRSGPLLAALPDGRLWIDSLYLDPGKPFLFFGGGTGFFPHKEWISLNAGSEFLPGTNWVDGAARHSETVAIRSDGTLWVSERPRPQWDRETGVPPPSKPSKVVQFGSDSGWKSVVREGSFSAVLLKQDGTLWRWGTTNWSSKTPWPGLRSFEPSRIGDDSDWTKILGYEGGTTYAWKRDGKGWAINPRVKLSKTGHVDLLEGVHPLPELDQIQLISIVSGWPRNMGVSEDGRLWSWDNAFSTKSANGETLLGNVARVGSSSDWSAIGGDYWAVAALKRDGTLWSWNRQKLPHEGETAPEEPSRLGTHSDWVGVSGTADGIAALAADGTLWHYQPRDKYYDGGDPMLSPSRKPSRITNIFKRPN